MPLKPSASQIAVTLSLCVGEKKDNVTPLKKKRAVWLRGKSEPAFISAGSWTRYCWNFYGVLWITSRICQLFLWFSILVVSYKELQISKWLFVSFLYCWTRFLVGSVWFWISADKSSRHCCDMRLKWLYLLCNAMSWRQPGGWNTVGGYGKIASQSGYMAVSVRLVEEKMGSRQEMNCFLLDWSVESVQCWPCSS